MANLQSYLILFFAINCNFCVYGNIARWIYDYIPERCNTNSVTPVSCEDVISIDGLIPHPDDCELFYYCVTPDQPPVCRECPAGLHFNPDLRLCDYPDVAGCNASNPEEPDRCAKNSVTPVSCEEVDEDSVISHPDDCQLFYYCLAPDNSPVCRQCPAQLHFNPKLHVCDYPENAGCSASIQ